MIPGADQLQELVDTLALTTGCPITLEDRDLNLVASSGHDEVIDDVRRESILRRRSTADVQQLFAAFGIAHAEEPLRIPGDAASGRLTRWCIPVRWRQVTYGYLWLLDPHEAVDRAGLSELQDVVAQVAAALALRSRTADRTTWAVGELLSADAGARERAAEELRRDGMLPASGDLVVVALASCGGGPLGPVNAWLLPRTVLSAPVGQRAALVVPAGVAGLDASDLAERAARALLVQHPAGVGAGVSGPVTAHDGHVAWRQADAALTVALSARDREPGVHVQGWANLGALRLLALGEHATLVETLADDRTRRLLDGDPELLRTARTWLHLGGSAQRTAAALSIHRQTLYQRLRRIEEVTGLGLEDGQDRLALHLLLALDAVDPSRHQ